jgi:hypothetical protein
LAILQTTAPLHGATQLDALMAKASGHRLLRDQRSSAMPAIA